MSSAMQARSILDSGVRPEVIGSPDLHGLESAVDYSSRNHLKGDPADNLRYIREVYTTLWQRFEAEESDT